MIPSAPGICLILSAAMLGVGAAGVLLRRNLLVVLMSLEIMLNGAGLAFASFARIRGDSLGHVAVIVGLSVAAAEAAVGLGIILACFRHRRTADADAFNQLRG